ncbi:signal peptide peptidase SppA [Propionicicella superfundia]|uniref:signal peptide peptidase SppA n=1 Tax=Propionicicella superfundia TaxID=348582 RepID=UPI0004160FC9|nr:signal peptide peptidase SppA [Propionicicella superfundia]
MDPITRVVRRFVPQAASRMILELDLDLGVTMYPPADPVSALRAMNAPAMRALVAGLREGARDPRVVGLVVHVGTCPYTPAQLDELATVVEDFAREKPVIAYSETFGEFGSATLAYRFATVAHQVWLQPSGEVGLSGLALAVTLLRGTLDKLGVEPQFGQRHEYKTAADQFVAREVTDANREMMQRIADSIVDDTVEVVAKRRGLTTDDVRAITDGPALGASAARELGLVDHIGYRDEVYSAAREQWGSDAELRYVHRLHPALPALRLVTEQRKPVVAVVPVRGGIVSGRPQPGPGGPQASADAVGAHLRRAVADPDVRAIVLRVDSPGGSYVASDAIRREVIQAKAAGTPVVASMGDVAASGGYFVSMAADEIVACPTTLTGSIGVLAGKFVLTGLTEKLGLTAEDIAAGRWATLMSVNAGFTDEQWDVLNARLDEIYDDFTAKAAADRRVDIAALRAVARGRVWTGHDAQRHNLVDHLGGLETAVQRACALAGLDRGRAAVRMSPRLPFLERLRPADSSQSAIAAPATESWAAIAAGGPDAVVRMAGAAIGWDVPGVLTMPWRIAIR